MSGKSIFLKHQKDSTQHIVDSEYCSRSLAIYFPKREFLIGKSRLMSKREKKMRTKWIDRLRRRPKRKVMSKFQVAKRMNHDSNRIKYKIQSVLDLRCAR
jgi:hypothetical protein